MQITKFGEFTLTKYQQTIESHIFCTPISTHTKQQMSQPKCLDWWTKKKLIGGYHKEIGPFFPLCVRLVVVSVRPSSAATQHNSRHQKNWPKSDFAAASPPHISDTHHAHTQTSVFLFFSQSQTDDFCAVRVKNSLHLQLKCRPANSHLLLILKVF